MFFFAILVAFICDGGAGRGGCGGEGAGGRRRRPVERGRVRWVVGDGGVGEGAGRGSAAAAGGAGEGAGGRLQSKNTIECP